MIRIVVLSIVSSLTYAADLYPVADKDNCTVGQKFIRQEHSPYVYDCVKFGKSNSIKFAGCIINGKVTPLNGTGEQIYTNQHYGYKFKCHQDEKGYFRVSIVGCIVDTKPVEVGKTGVYTDLQNDYGYLWGCRDIEGNVQITREGCYLGPETEDEVFLKVNETKEIPELEQYCKCAYNGNAVMCSSRLDNLNAY